LNGAVEEFLQKPKFLFLQELAENSEKIYVSGGVGLNLLGCISIYFNNFFNNADNQKSKSTGAT